METPEHPERIPSILELAALILQAGALAFQKDDYQIASMATASACGLYFALTRYDKYHAKAAHFAFRCNMFAISPDEPITTAARTLLRNGYIQGAYHVDVTSDVAARLFPMMRTAYSQYIEEVTNG